MKYPRQAALHLMVAACFAVLPVQAAAQSANDPLSVVSEQDFLNAISLLRPPLDVKKTDDGFTLTLPNGLEANAQLQNCEDRATSSNCRTLSIIVNLLKPEGKSREELLELVNQLNRRDIHGRSFLNNGDQIITRWTFFATGHESSRGLATKLVNWDAFVRGAATLIYGQQRGD